MPFPRHLTRRTRIALLASIGALILYGLLGALALPALLRPQLEKAATSYLHRHVTIGKITINPFLLRMTIRDVTIQEPDAPLLKFAALTLDAELASLWQRGPVLREITLERPEIRIVRLDASHYNFSDLLQHPTQKTDKQDAPLPRFALNNIRILNGKIDFDDHLQHSHQVISDLQLALPFVSTLPYALDQYIQPGLSGKLNGSNFKLAGQTKPFKESRETRLTFSLDGLELPQYLAYVSLPQDVNLQSGSLSGKLDIVFREDRDQPKLLVEGQLQLHNGRLDYRGQPLLTLPGVLVEAKNMEPLLQKFRFAQIDIQKPAISITRDASGKSNWQAAFPPGKAAVKSTNAVPTSQPLLLEVGQFTLNEGRIDWPGSKKLPALTLGALKINGIVLDSGKQQASVNEILADKTEINLAFEKTGQLDLLSLLPTTQTTPHPEAGKKPAWQIKLTKFALENSALRLDDQRQGSAPPLALSRLMLHIANVDTASSVPAQLDFTAQAGKRGQISIAGPFVSQPFSARWQTEIKDFDLAFTQPYLNPYLNIQLASIWLAAKGEAQIASTPKLAVNYRGNLALNDFHAIDKLNGADFLKWRTLALNGVDAQSEPLRLDLSEVRLTDFYSRLILAQNGRLNLQDILLQEGKATSITSSEPTAAKPLPVQKKAPLPPVNIRKIVLSNGNINYTDNLIQPHFSANLQDMAGSVSGLSSAENARASVDLRGNIDHIAPLTIAGSVNPLAQKSFVDIKAAVKGYELTAASAYFGKYAGYGIDKGKLSLDLAYFIDNGLLKASNQLVLDQLTLGEKVESPDATKLPVKFALALLTDRHGVINLNLPIEGSLNDPQFRIGKIIWQVLGNLLEKAVTSPFSAISSLLGDDATFSRIEFEAGHADLSAGARASLGKLAKALAERPALKLDIAGWVDPQIDAEALKRQQLEEKLRARKLVLLTGHGESVDDSAAHNISEEERPKLLEYIYTQEKITLPANTAKPQQPADMEKLILANIHIGDDTLRDLGMRRARIVMDALNAAGLDEARLFLLKPRLDPPADDIKKDGGKATRVQFVLK